MRGLKLLLLLAPVAATAAPLPECAIPRATSTIAIDGRLDEAAWAATPLIDQFSFPWWTAGAKDRTEARLLWDDDHLYVGFTAFDPHISAVLTTRDDPVSRDDCVEIFIAPDTSDVRQYFNFEFNALGTILDRSPAQKRSKSWNAAGVQVA
ncbi:MAG: carbohydrate-binding family 9-like protein, partial [Candidatus Latescibacteria bacterium]|nr:carbohydrate-binding family 9-like protein [Candidatus Latescibacterota bacterium]